MGKVSLSDAPDAAGISQVVDLTVAENKALKKTILSLSLRIFAFLIISIVLPMLFIRCILFSKRENDVKILFVIAPFILLAFNLLFWYMEVNYLYVLMLLWNAI